jgi:uncharacterized protein YhaN
MILKGWHLESYGIFSDWTLDNLGGGITVLHGPNEAGKSTLLHFIRGVLFGYPGKKYEGKGFVPKIRDGAHGGRLFIEADNGRWTLERMVGQNRHPSLFRPDDTRAEITELEGLLHHADKTLFKSVFTFELDDLVSLGGEDAEKVRDRLFSAGISGAGKSASELFSELGGEKEELYKKSGRKTPLNLLFIELEALEKTKKELVAKTREYPLGKARMEELSEKVVLLEHEREEVFNEGTRLGALLKLCPPLREQEKLKAKIDGLNAPDSFPVKGTTRLEVLLEKRRSATLEVEKLERSKNNFAQELDGLKIDQALLKAAESCERLKKSLPLQRDRMERFLKTERDAEIARADFSLTLEEMGKHWTPDRVSAIDLGPERLAEVKRLAEELNDAARELELATRAQGADAAKTVNAQTPLQPAIALVLTVAFAIGGFFAPEGLALPLFASAALSAAFALLWKFKASPAPKKSPLDTKAGGAQEDFGRADSAWREALVHWGLTEGDTASPETVIQLFTGLKAARKEQVALERKDKEVQALGNEIHTWEEDAREVLCATPSLEKETLAVAVERYVLSAEAEAGKKVRYDRLNRELATTADTHAEHRDILTVTEKELSSLFEAASVPDAESYRQKAELFEQRRELEGKLENATAQISDMSAEGSETLLAEARTGLMDKWESDHNIATQRYKALGEKIIDTTRMLGGLENELGELENSSQLAECEARIEGVREEANALAKRWRIAALTQALVRTTLDEYTSANQPEALASASQLFSTLTDGRYQRVVHLPKEGTKAEQLVVVKPDGAHLNAEQLSRGTREGLYICLRLALADQYGKRRGRLPLIMDDVLVNLDPVRAEATLTALARFAKDNQVLFFTCHPETVERIKRVDPTVRVLDL